jgi:hypothetical protein
MPSSGEILSALTLGLLGAGHCIGMCGGISAALAFALGPRCGALRRHALLACYSLGRIASYTLLGVLAGGALELTLPQSAQGVLRIVAGASLVATGLALAGWSRALALLERGGSLLWKRIGPLAARIGPPDSVPVALVAGAAWGLLPCGLVYGALAWSSAGADATRGGVLMAAFGLGTLPAVLASGSLAAQLQALLRRRELRILAALCVCAFGIWTLAAAGGGQGHHAHHH